jgi:CDP-glucose 4,6-dehydratase
VAVDHVAAWHGRRVLVTGHSGFIGAWLCTALVRAGARVSGFSLSGDVHSVRRAGWLAGLGVHDIIGDVRDADTVDAAMRRARPDAVFHLAAQGLVGEGLRDPHTTLMTNIGGSINVLEAVRRHQPRTLVHVTSDKCYRNQEWSFAYRENDELGGGCPYSVSKAAAELVFEGYVANYGHLPGATAMASLRFSNVIGGGDFSRERLIPDCVRAMTAAGPIRLRMPTATRPWQQVLDVVDGLLVLGSHLDAGTVPTGGTYNLTPAKASDLTVAAVVAMFVDAWGGGVAVEVEAGHPLDSEHQLLYLDGRKAERQWGWRHRLDVAEAVRRTASWYRRHADGADERTLTLEQIDEYAADVANPMVVTV